MEILLIEDDVETQAHLVSCLEAQNHRVTLASTGEVGMKYALEREYAAIVLDRILPGMDGLVPASNSRTSPVSRFERRLPWLH